MAQPAVNDVLTWDGTKGVYAPNPALSLALTDTYIFVGNSIGVATGVPLTLNDVPGPFSLGNTGLLTMPDASASGRGLLNATGWATVGFLHNDGLGNLEFQAVAGSQDLAATLAIGNTTGGIAITSDDLGTELRVFDSNKGYFTNSLGAVGITEEVFVNQNKLIVSTIATTVGHDTLIQFDSPSYNITNITTDSYLYVDSSGNLIAGSTPVQGSGTLNYIPKFTPDGVTLGDSLIFDDGTNVGVGTNTPAVTFEIKGIGNSVATNSFRVNNSDNTIILNLADNGRFRLRNSDDSTTLSLDPVGSGGSCEILTTNTEIKFQNVDGEYWFNRSAAGRVLLYSNGRNLSLSAVTGGAANLTINSTTGNVSIDNATASTVPYFDASKNLISSAITPTELGYLTGATSPLQAQIDAIVSGLSWKQAVRVRTTGNITLSGTQTIDGVAVIATDRVLVMDQTDPKENGIYVCSAGAWSRSTDADTGAELLQATVATQEGTLYADQQYVCTTNAPIVIGVSNIVFILVGGTTYVGTTNRITITGNTIDIASTYIGQTSITTLGTVTTGTWNGTAINYAYIASMTSANLAGIISDETGYSTGAVLVFSKSPTIEAPTISGITTLTSALNEAKGSDIASATTTDIGAATGNFVHITGTTAITGLGTIQAGTRRIVRFDGILTLTHNATSLILPTGANITTAANDVATFVSEGSGNWRCVEYMRSNGQSPSMYEVSDTTRYTNTGNTTENVLTSLLITGGTYTNKVFEVYVKTITNATANNKTFRMYFNSTPDLAGSPVLAATYIATSVGGNFSRKFKDLAGTIKNYVAVATSFSNFEAAATSTATENTLSVDLASNMYIVITAQNAVAGDSAIVDFCYTQNIT